jgi:hypothetical protein
VDVIDVTSDPVAIIAGLALPLIAWVLIAGARQLLADPGTDPLVAGMGFVIVLGIAWIALPLVSAGIMFWGELLASAVDG